MKIYIIQLEKEHFINLVGNKKTTGFSLFYPNSRNHKIFIKRTKKIKKTIEHELSHIFINSLKIKKLINQREFKKVLKNNQFRNYGKKIYNTSFKLREEFLADFISYVISGTKKEKEYIKNKYPKNFYIIKKLSKKFKPKLIYI